MVSLPHIIETALLLLVAFLIGCFLGYALRSLTRPRSNVKPSGASALETAPEPQSEPVPQSTTEPVAEAARAPAASEASPESAKPRKSPAKPRAAARSPRAQTALSPKPPRRRRAKPESPDR